MACHPHICGTYPICKTLSITKLEPCTMRSCFCYFSCATWEKRVTHNQLSIPSGLKCTENSIQNWREKMGIRTSFFEYLSSLHKFLKTSRKCLYCGTVRGTIYPGRRRMSPSRVTWTNVENIRVQTYSTSKHTMTKCIFNSTEDV